jgi:ArsR family transcriptional regulator
MMPITRRGEIGLQFGEPEAVHDSTPSTIKAGMATEDIQITMNQDQQLNPQLMSTAAGRACELMKTLGHKDRLMVLCHLADGERSVGELAGLLDIPQSPLSQHLARMRKESLVKTRRQSQTIFYSLASDEVRKIIGLLHEMYCSDAAARKSA